MRILVRSRAWSAFAACTVVVLGALGVTTPSGAVSRNVRVRVAHHKAPVTISIATAGATAVYDPVFTGLASGLFKRNGFNVLWDNLTPSAAAAAIINGDVNLAMAGNSMVASILVSPTAKVIFTNGPTVFYLVASAGIKNISQLAGKTCAATTAGGAIDTAIRGAFAAAHVPVNVTYLQTNSASLAALETGRVQCAGVSPPTYEQAQEAGLSVVEPISAYVQTSFIAANSAWAKQHKAALVGFLKVFAKAVTLTRDNRLDAEKGLSTYVGTTFLAQLNGSWNQYRKYWELEPYPVGQMRSTLAGLATANPPVPQAVSASPSQVIDNTYMAACGKACVIPSLAKGPWI